MYVMLAIAQAEHQFGKSFAAQPPRLPRGDAHLVKAWRAGAPDPRVEVCKHSFHIRRRVRRREHDRQAGNVVVTGRPPQVRKRGAGFDQ